MSDPVIDPTARIAPGAVIGADVSIGPYCIVGPHVTLDSGVRLVSHVNVAGHTSIGAGTVVHPFASLGTPPQSLGYKGEPTRLEIGAGNDIREHVTMNLGTAADRGVTTVGDNCFFMVGSHVAHDCVVGNKVVFANNVLLGGHSQIGDNVVFGGGVAVRQFVRIGEGAMIVGLSGVRADVIPFGMAHGPLADLVGLNVVGMRRRGFSHQRLKAVRDFYQRLFHGGGVFAERLAAVRPMASLDPAIAEILAFIDGGIKRPLCMPHNASGKTSERAQP